MSALDTDAGPARLRGLVEAVVPLRMAELVDVDYDTLRTHLDHMRCGIEHAEGGQCRGAVMIIGSHADELMYTPGTPGSTAARRALVDGIAVMALTTEGGAWSILGGLHFCAWPHEGCPTPPRLALREPEASRWVDPPPPRPIVDIPLPDFEEDRHGPAA